MFTFFKKLLLLPKKSDFWSKKNPTRNQIGMIVFSNILYLNWAFLSCVWFLPQSHLKLFRLLYIQNKNWTDAKLFGIFICIIIPLNFRPFLCLLTYDCIAIWEYIWLVWTRMIGECLSRYFRNFVHNWIQFWRTYHQNYDKFGLMLCHRDMMPTNNTRINPIKIIFLNCLKTEIRCPQFHGFWE